MIVGVGIDIIEVARMRRTLERYGKHFLDHVFTEDEQQEAPGGVGGASYFAGRWAAKEAVAKALGTGIGESCGWKDVRVVRSANGKPEVVLDGPASLRASELAVGCIHISISHERHLACASVVMEKLN